MSFTTVERASAPLYRSKLFLPGSQAYVDAANGFMANQFLFGSSYPFRPIRQSIDDFLQLGFDEAVLDKLLYGNAARLFKL